MSDDDVEIIHSSQSIESLHQQVLNNQIIPNLQSDNQKLQQSNKSLEIEIKQYKSLLEQTLETLRQSERDQNTLKLQLSQKDFQLQVIQANVEDRQKSGKIESHQKLKESNSNRDSFGNKQTNVSSIGGFLSSTQSPRCQCDGFNNRGQTLIEILKKIQFSLKQNELTTYSQELTKILQEFEDNLKQFLTLHEQYAIEIHRNRLDQTEKQSQIKQQSSPSMSDHFHSLEDQNTIQNPNQQILNNDDLDTSQFESEYNYFIYNLYISITLNQLSQYFQEKQQKSFLYNYNTSNCNLNVSKCHWQN